MIDLREDSTDAFKSECVCDHVDFVQSWVIHLDEAIHFTDLWRVIDALDVDAHAQRVVRILAEVPIQVAASLFSAATPAPVIHELLQLLEIHEADVINVSVFLSIEHYSGGHATIA